jgi:hypothetical protein
MAGPYEPQPDPTAATPPPGQYPPPPVPPAPAEPPTTQYPAPAQGQYPPPPGQYPPPPGQYPPPPGQYPAPPGQYPAAAADPNLPPVQPPPAGGQFPLPGQYPTAPSYPAPAPTKSRGGRQIGRIGIGVLVAIILLVVRVALFGNHSSSPSGSSAPPAPKDAWESTPAATYAIGDAGIQLPTATAVDGFTAAEVAADLQTVKKILIAGRLDDTMLVKHDPSAVLALFAPGYKPHAQDRFDKHEFMYYGTQIAPGQTLVGSVRDKGTITFTGRVESGVRVLDVTTNFVWVYAFGGQLKEPGDHLVSIHDTNTWEFPSAKDVEASDVGLYVSELNYSVYNMDCDLMNKDYLGLGKPVYVPGSSADPAAEDAKALDPNTPVNTGTNSC